MLRRGDMRALQLGGRRQWRIERAEFEGYIPAGSRITRHDSDATTDAFIIEHSCCPGSLAISAGSARRNRTAHPISGCAAHMTSALAPAVCSTRPCLLWSWSVSDPEALDSDDLACGVDDDPHVSGEGGGETGDGDELLCPQRRCP